MALPSVHEPNISEPVKIENWRLENLIEAGYEVEAAEVLASDPQIDLHKAIEMREQGCSSRLAIEILA